MNRIPLWAWCAPIVAAVVFYGLAVNEAHQNGVNMCAPFTAVTGPLGLISCVNSDDMKRGACEPMSAANGPLGLVACKIDEEPSNPSPAPPQ